MSRQTIQPESQLHNFPRQPTSFLGRTTEIERIIETLTAPGCRLLTLTGPGGVGKTRLAARVAAKAAADFDQEACFVPLQSLNAPDLLAETIAEAIGLFLTGQSSPAVQLLSYLRDKELLLLLDNFEQLLVPSAANSSEAGNHCLNLLTRILDTTPAVTLLVTSREALKLQGEWLFPVRGLSFPKTDPANNIEDYAAVRLFVERARRGRPDFSLAEERAGVIDICCLVEGNPLALELAASWVKTQPCRAITTQIEQSLAFLATGLRDVPERHRSLVAVFDHSWSLLTETEREVFKQLAVFQSNFRQPAAEQVAGATAPLLSVLVDKSLLQWDPEKHYHIHELLRQYAAERLQESSADLAQTHRRHSVYYADFLHQRFGDVMGGRQKEAAAEIEQALSNIRLAWRWAVSQNEVELIRKAAQTLALFYQFSGRYLEGARAFEAASHGLESLPPTKAVELTQVVILVDRAWFYIRLGWLEQAETVLARGQTLYDRLQRPPLPGHGTDPRLPLGIIASIYGDYATAARLGKKVRQVSETHGHLWNRQLACYLLARAALAQGENDAARQYARQAYAITEKTRDRWFMAYCHNELGQVAQAQGDHEKAKAHYETSYGIRQEFDDPEGMAVAQTYLGEVALARHDLPAAEKLYRQSLKIYEEINDQGGIATCLAGLGHTASAAGDYRAARQHFHQALRRAREIGFVPLTLSILAGVGPWLWQTGARVRSLELLALTRNHPASAPATKAAAQQKLARYKVELPPDAAAAAIQRGQSTNLETIATSVQADLAAPQEPSLALPAQSSQLEPETQTLVESLTPRETEVLQLIAAGHTNQEIADKLVIVEGTVKAHASNIYGKLQVGNRTEAVAKAQVLDLL